MRVWYLGIDKKLLIENEIRYRWRAMLKSYHGSFGYFCVDGIGDFQTHINGR